MPKGHYPGGSSIIKPGSSWFGKKRHKSDEGTPTGRKPKNIFKLTAEGRRAEQEFLTQIAAERERLGIKPDSPKDDKNTFKKLNRKRRRKKRSA